MLLYSRLLCGGLHLSRWVCAADVGVFWQPFCAELEGPLEPVAALCLGQAGVRFRKRGRPHPCAPAAAPRRVANL